LTSAFDFKNPNRDWTAFTLPDTADYLARIDRSSQGVHLVIPKMQRPTAQAARQRSARPLPYALFADGRLDERGRFVIGLANHGSSGAVFQVYDYSDRQGPWRYTLEAGKQYEASEWHQAAVLANYDLAVHGPNGFFRHFRGDLSAPAAQITVGAVYNRDHGSIALMIENAGSITATVSIAQSDIYPVGSRQTRVRNYDLKPKTSIRDVWTLAASDGWYDLSVTLAAGTFLRRYAGHVETGKPSKTDPAIGSMRLEDAI
jgi:phospholipase C